MKIGLPILLLLLPIINTTFRVHVIPHSHMDPGWLQTKNEYYDSKVGRIYKSVFDALNENPNRTFVFAEITYLMMWYTRATEQEKEIFRQNIQNGRIEIVNGGYVMNDEATPYYQDIIDQMRLGLQIVEREFKTKVTTGWSLDPFGHSTGNALVLSQLGYKQAVYCRLHHQENSWRINEGKLQFNYLPFKNELNKKIFIHFTGNSYANSYCEDYCMNDGASPAKNDAQVKPHVDRFMRGILNLRKGHLNKDVYMHLLGHDFHYDNGNKIFVKFETIMDYVNKNGYNGEKVEMFYSTPSRYFNEIFNSFVVNNVQIPEESDHDYFTYAMERYDYWSGYFTSRPFLKGTVYKLSNLFRTSSKFYTEFMLKSKLNVPETESLLKLISDFQHHDTVTGTSRERVSRDYIEQGNREISKINSEMSNFIKDKAIDKSLSAPNEIKVCMANPIIDFGCENVLAVSNNDDEKIINLFNPLIDGKILISLEQVEAPANNKRIEVFYEGNRIASDFYCIDKRAFGYKYKCFLSFFLDLKRDISIIPITLKKSDKDALKVESLPEDKFELFEKNPKVEKLAYNPKEDKYELLLNDNMPSVNYEFSMLFGKYVGIAHGHTDVRPSSYTPDGAYVFSPSTLYPEISKVTTTDSFVVKGEISTSIIKRYSSIPCYVIETFYHNPFFSKVDHIFDPIRNVDGENYIFKIESNIKNNITIDGVSGDRAEFWTDSNGIQMVRRVVDYVYKYNHHEDEKIANNFYPVTTSISIREKEQKTYSREKRYENLSKNDKMISIFTDRPQAGGAMKEGELMLNINRNCKYDDYKGMQEGLNEQNSNSIYFKVSHLVIFGHNIFEGQEKPLKTSRFANNYFHNTPLLFTPNFMKEKAASFISTVFEYDENVLLSFQIVNDKLIIAQFYVDYDFYYEGEENKNSVIIIHNNKVKGLKVKIDLTGVKNLNSSVVNTKNYFLSDEVPEYKFTLGNNDFAFAYLYLG